MNPGEKLSFFFQPDPSLSGQYFDTVRRKGFPEPEKRLMLAVLEDAVLCFQEYILAKDGKRKRLFHDAKEWILEGGGDWLFSFENVCEALGMDPRYIRRGLMEWEHRLLTGACDPKRSRTLGPAKKRPGRKKFRAAA